MTWRLLASALAAAAPAWLADPAAAQAPYNAGFRLARVQAAGDAVPLAVWYPTRSRRLLGTRVGVFRLDAVRDAAPASGSFGLIAISHGTGGGYLNHRSTARALARAGYVVVAPHHPGSTWQDGARIGRRIALDRRPRHLSGAISWALADTRLGPRIDRRRIGAIGYSAGGYTVLAALGARANLEFATVHCRVNPEDNRFCGFERLRQRLEGFVTLQTGWLTPHRDPRIRAAMLWAPMGALFGQGGFDKIRARLLIYRAGHDHILRHPWHAAQIHRYLRRAGIAHRYVTIRNAGHYAFITPFPLLARMFAGEVNRDPPGFDRSAFQRRLARDTVHFFNSSLK